MSIERGWKPQDVPAPFFVRVADRLYGECERAIEAGRIDARSPIGDAALDYREMRDEMATGAPPRRSEAPGQRVSFLDAGIGGDSAFTTGVVYAVRWRPWGRQALVRSRVHWVDVDVHETVGRWVMCRNLYPSLG